MYRKTIFARWSSYTLKLEKKKNKKQKMKSKNKWNEMTTTEGGADGKSAPN